MAPGAPTPTSGDAHLRRYLFFKGFMGHATTKLMMLPPCQLYEQGR